MLATQVVEVILEQVVDVPAPQEAAGVEEVETTIPQEQAQQSPAYNEAWLRSILRGGNHNGE